MADIFDFGDALGPVKVLHVCEEKIRANVEAVLSEAATRRELPRQAATRLADARVQEAMDYRRFGAL